MPHVSWSYRLRLLSLFCVAYTFFYIYPNFWSESPAKELPLLWIDRVVPLVPWTFLVYLSDYLLAAVVIASIREQEVFDSFARMAFATLFLCGAFFLFFPTTYPRPEYPKSDHLLIQMAMNLIATADTPKNCFPSMHVAITGIAVWAFRRVAPAKVPWFVLWALAIYASTLTTKQHYFADIVGGLFVVVTVASLERWYLWKLAKPRWVGTLLRR